MATGDWVLSIDADERVTPELKTAILNALNKPGEAVAFSIPRRSSYCGKMIHFGDWGNDRVVRLFKRNTAQFSDSKVHESLQVSGPIKALHTPLIHYAFKDRDEVTAKMQQYSSLGALQQYQAGKRAHFGSAVWHGAWTFIRGHILRGGFLDGSAGLQLALSKKGCYYRYRKLALTLKKI